jgi:hypothetical protein
LGGILINFDSLTPFATYSTYTSSGVSISSPDGLEVLPYSTEDGPNENVRRQRSGQREYFHYGFRKHRDWRRDSGLRHDGGRRARHHFPAGSERERRWFRDLFSVVVIFGENISFDHYFGTYPTAVNPPGEPRFLAHPGTPVANTLATPNAPWSNLLTANPNLNPRMARLPRILSG